MSQIENNKVKFIRTDREAGGEVFDFLVNLRTSKNEPIRTSKLQAETLTDIATIDSSLHKYVQHNAVLANVCLEILLKILNDSGQVHLTPDSKEYGYLVKRFGQSHVALNEAYEWLKLGVLDIQNLSTKMTEEPIPEFLNLQHDLTFCNVDSSKLRNFTVACGGIQEMLYMLDMLLEVLPKIDIVLLTKGYVLNDCILDADASLYSFMLNFFIEALPEFLYKKASSQKPTASTLKTVVKRITPVMRESLRVYFTEYFDRRRPQDPESIQALLKCKLKCKGILKQEMDRQIENQLESCITSAPTTPPTSSLPTDRNETDEAYNAFLDLARKFDFQTQIGEDNFKDLVSRLKATPQSIPALAQMLQAQEDNTIDSYMTSFMRYRYDRINRAVRTAFSKATRNKEERRLKFKSDVLNYFKRHIMTVLEDRHIEIDSEVKLSGVLLNREPESSSTSDKDISLSHGDIINILVEIDSYCTNAFVTIGDIPVKDIEPQVFGLVDIALGAVEDLNDSMYTKPFTEKELTESFDSSELIEDPDNAFMYSLTDAKVLGVKIFKASVALEGKPSRLEMHFTLGSRLSKDKVLRVELLNGSNFIVLPLVLDTSVASFLGHSDQRPDIIH